jgi:hypothetical protein
MRLPNNSLGAGFGGLFWVSSDLSACKVEIVLKQRGEAFAVSYFPFLCILFNIPIGEEVTQYARVWKKI